jgi:hypothetical protein
VTSKNDGQTPEFRMATRDTPEARDEATEVSDADLMLLSAFVDGALEPEQEHALLARLDVEPRLVDALSAFAAMRGALHGRERSIDVADQVMAAVAPEALSDTVDGALLGGMLLADGEAAADRVPVSPASDAALYGFLRATEVVRLSFAELPALPHSVAPAIESALVDDERARELAMQLADGDSASGAVDSLATLLDDPAHGARRFDDVVQFMQTSARVGQELRRSIAATEAAHAGERAIQAIQASASVPQKAAGGGRSPVRERQATLFERFSRLIPVGVALAAIAVFALVGRDETKDGAGPQLEPVNDTLALAPFDVLPDNTSTVETLETGAGAAVVFSTSASHITIIWVGGGDTSEQGT